MTSLWAVPCRSRGQTLCRRPLVVVLCSGDMVEAPQLINSAVFLAALPLSKCIVQHFWSVSLASLWTSKVRYKILQTEGLLGFVKPDNFIH